MGTKKTPSDLQREAEQLVAEGKMHTLEQLIEAMARTRAKHQKAILDPRLRHALPVPATVRSPPLTLLRSALGR